eukprot:1142169-Pelagomonas_calceolata.AAC.2
MAATTCTHLHVYSRARQSGHALISYESPACALCKKVDSVRGKAGYGCKARGTEKQKPLCTSGEQPRQEERKSKIHNKVTHTHTHRTRLYSYSASGVSNHLVNGQPAGGGVRDGYVHSLKERLLPHLSCPVCFCRSCTAVPAAAAAAAAAVAAAVAVADNDGVDRVGDYAAAADVDDEGHSCGLEDSGGRAGALGAGCWGFAVVAECLVDGASGVEAAG